MRMTTVVNPARRYPGAGSRVGGRIMTRYSIQRVAVIGQYIVQIRLHGNGFAVKAVMDCPAAGQRANIRKQKGSIRKHEHGIRLHCY